MQWRHREALHLHADHWVRFDGGLYNYAIRSWAAATYGVEYILVLTWRCGDNSAIG
jgi:hypothetical protein